MENDPYHYWRDVQRIQLGISANLFMVFASAILGYVLNFLVTNKNKIDDCSQTTLSISLIFLFLSLFFYSLFTHNRLNDFRETARLFKQGKTEKQVGELTIEQGELTWKLYKWERLTLIIGFTISFIGFVLFIYS